jgi:hypothetical protein
VAAYKKQQALKSDLKVIKKQVKQIVKSELDFVQEHKYEHFYTNEALSTTGVILDLTDIPQGDTTNERDGANIILKSLQIRAQLTVADSTNVVRFSIFQWKPSSTTDPPGLSDLFCDSLKPWISYFLPLRPSKFKIMYDEVKLFDTYHPYQPIELSFNLNLKIGYDLAATTGPSHVYLIMSSDSTTSSHPQAIVTSLVTFTDS